MIEDANDVEQRVKTRYDFAGLDPGDMSLWKSRSATEFGLAPSSLMTRVDESLPGGVGNLFGACDMRRHIERRCSYAITYRFISRYVFIYTM